jgi:tetratricopeptide (TPR) repeat protein
MKKIQNLSLLLVFCTLVTSSFAQQTTVFTEANLTYKRGDNFYQKGVFGSAMTEFKKAINLLEPTNEAESKLLKIRAELGYAKSAVRLELPNGENLILDFIRKHQPDPIANQALIELANYFYNAKKYEKAIEYFSQIPADDLNREQRSEVKFKTGYSFFVQKKFAPARANFADIRTIENIYYYPSNYYYGLTEFFSGDYDEAVRSFRLVEKSKKYRPYIPYYIGQIYFAQGDFEKVLAYVEPKLTDSKLKNRRELYQLVGQTYLEINEPVKALPFLEYYAANAPKMTEGEFYQLAYAQYQQGDYSKAIKNFEQLDNVDSELGQYAHFYRGDALLKKGNKTSAYSSFRSASRMDYDAALREDALFAYAKLGYELKKDREALLALQSIPRSSKYYSEAQTLMSDIFLNTRDFKRAMEILDGVENKTPELQETYQKVAYFRGQQLYAEENFAEAKTVFNKSLNKPVNQEYKALAIYWLGDIAHQEKDYQQSNKHISEFLTLSKTVKNLPDESSVFTANYLQGYNYLKQKKYSSALGYFQDAVAGIKRNSAFIRNKMVRDDILGDATLRAGDCLFKKNQYPQAINYYNDAIDKGYAGYEYAIFQKAIIEGLRGRTTEKILALENLVQNHPNSDYADDALYQMGITYQNIGQLGQAVKPLLDLTGRYPNSKLVVPSLLSLGLISYNQGNQSGSIEYYKRVFSNNPSADEANAALAALQEIYVDVLGDPDGYAAFLETVPGYKLDNAEKDDLNFQAAESAFESNNYDRAINGYTDYIRKYPNGRNLLIAHFHRGESYAYKKNYGQALQDYEWVIERGQSRYFVRSMEKAAIISYHNEKNYQKAYNYYSQLEQIATSAEQRFDAQLGAMGSAYRLGNQAAVAQLAQKVANNPNADKGQIAVANFYLGKQAFDSKNYGGAMSYLNNVIANSDNEQTAEARYLVAYIHYVQRDLTTAQQLCINANKESSSYPYWVAKSILLLADIFVEQESYFNAKASLEALLENYDGDADIVNEAKIKLDQVKRQLDAQNRLESADTPGSFLIEEEEGN